MSLPPRPDPVVSPPVRRTAPTARLAPSWVGLALIALALAPASAWAGSPEEDAARIIYQEGKTLFGEGRYDEALERFEKAFVVVQNDVLRYYLGRTHAALGRCDEAIPLLASVRDKVPARLEPERQRDVLACRLPRARERAEAYDCRGALADIEALEALDPDEDVAAELGDLRAGVESCAFYFRGDGEGSRKAARLVAGARRYLGGGHHERARMAADASAAVQPSRAADYIRAVSLRHLGRCSEALEALERLAEPGALRGPDERVRAEAETACLLERGRALVAEERCAEAMHILDRLDGRLKERDERWRTEAMAHCGPKSTPFSLDSPARKAAHRLWVAGVAARASGDRDRAIDLFTKARALSDEPVIRRDLSALHLERGACHDAAHELSGIPEALRRPHDLAVVSACTRFAPAAALPSAAIAAHVAAIVEGIMARERGEHAEAAAIFAAPVRDGRNDRLWALRVDSLYQCDDCDAYLAELAVAGDRESLLSHTANRRQVCLDRGTAARIERGEGLQAITPPPPPLWQRDVFAWSVLGGGLALVGAGGAMLGQVAALRDEQGDLEQEFQDARNGGQLEGSPAITDIRSRHADVSAEKDAWQIAGLTVGAVGLVAVGAGVFLLVWDPAEASAERAWHVDVRLDRVVFGASF